MSASTSTPEPRPRSISLPAGFSALKYRNYRLLFSGQLVSITGTWMQTIAISWLVLEMTNSAFKLGLVNVLQFSPILVIGLFAGVVADRFNRRHILMATQFMLGLLAISLTALSWSGRIELWHIYALAMGTGVVNAFDMPARQALVGDIVGKDDLPNAIALNATVFNTGRLIGPAIGGVLLSTFGATLCFGINAISFGAVLLCLLMMNMVKSQKSRGSKGIQQIREGIAYVRSTQIVMLTMLVVMLVGVFGLNFQVWVPLLARDEFSSGAGGFGFMMATLGLGSLTGALALAFSRGGPSTRRMLATAGLLGVAEVFLAIVARYTGELVIGMIFVFVLGFAMTSTMAMANTVVQSTTPPELRGRVMSVYMTVFAGSAPFGALLAGAMADAIGTPASLVVGGSISLFVALYVAYRAGYLTRLSPEGHPAR